MTNADLIDKINTAPAKPQDSSPALAHSLISGSTSRTPSCIEH